MSLLEGSAARGKGGSDRNKETQRMRFRFKIVFLIQSAKRSTCPAWRHKWQRHSKRQTDVSYLERVHVDVGHY